MARLIPEINPKVNLRDLVGLILVMMLPGWMKLRIRNRPVLQPEPVNASGDWMSLFDSDKEEKLPYAVCHSSEPSEVISVDVQRLRLIMPTKWSKMKLTLHMR